MGPLPDPKIDQAAERDQIREGSQEGGGEQSRCTGGGFQLGQTHTLYGAKRDGHLAQLVIPQYEGLRSRKLRLQAKGGGDHRCDIQRNRWHYPSGRRADARGGVHVPD